MKYFVIITLVICVLGVSFAFAAQAKTVTSSQTTVGQTVVQNGSSVDFTAQSLAIMAENEVKNTVKYLMPIESLLSVVPFVGVFSALGLVLQFFQLPILLVFMIFGGLL